MGYEISYKGVNSDRRPLIDIIQYLGLRRSVIIFRAFRNCKTFADIDRADMAICFAGVEGYPVRRLIAHYHGDHALILWSKAKRGDTSTIPARSE